MGSELVEMVDMKEALCLVESVQVSCMEAFYRVAKTHRMPQVAGHFPQKRR